jgi:hypothetical protein
VALSVTHRFVLDVRVGPRTLELAKQLVATVALCRAGTYPLLLIDDHRPYPMAILEVLGVIWHRRRRYGRGRKKYPALKPPPGLWVGVVRKERDAAGRVQRVRTRALFGRRRDIRKRMAQLELGHEINISHLERLNGTLRSQQTRLARRTRNRSQQESRLGWALALWRDWTNWMQPHESLRGRTPAMVAGLTDRVWSVADYVTYPVHVSELQRAIWAEEREKVLRSPLEGQKRRKILPTS